MLRGSVLRGSVLRGSVLRRGRQLCPLRPRVGGVARRPPLVILAGFLVVLAAVAAGLKWALGEQHVPSAKGLVVFAGLAWPFFVGAVGAGVLALVFRAVAAGLRRRSAGRGVGTLRPLETVAALGVALLLTIGVAGDAGTAFLSLGLVGFALTIAFQRPILSLAGWLAIRFGRLFREGERIEVAGIAGDVIEITLFSTRLWEVGSPNSPLAMGAALSPMRPTGRIVHLSNATFLEQAVANATSDISFVFDEFEVAVAYEADWRLARSLLEDVSRRVLDPQTHARAAADYERLVMNLPTPPGEFPREPVVNMRLLDSWIELRLRYLVDVRGRAVARTKLAEAWQEASGAHPDKLPNVYPRVQRMEVGADGRPRA